MYVCKADSGILDQSDFRKQLLFLQSILPNKRLPWTIIVTHKDRHRSRETRFLHSIKEIGAVIGPFSQDVTATFCSLSAYPVFSYFKRKLEETGTLLSIDEMMAEDGGHSVGLFLKPWV